MVIIGAKGCAKEVFDIVLQSEPVAPVYFFDDINKDVPDLIFGKYPVIRSMELLESHFKDTSRDFCLGLGFPKLRYKLAQKCLMIGGQLVSTISLKALIGRFGNIIGDGCTIMMGIVITNCVTIGEGSLLNVGCTISHDSIIGQ